MLSKKLVSSCLQFVAVGVSEAAAPGQKQKSSLLGTGEQEKY